MKLTWSAFALSDRDAIFTYIETDNPAAAVLIDERIVAAARRLLAFPASGRVGRIAGTRELVINGTPYIARLIPLLRRQFEFFVCFTAHRNGRKICRKIIAL